jgi:hypothetical protein
MWRGKETAALSTISTWLSGRRIESVVANDITGGDTALTAGPVLHRPEISGKVAGSLTKLSACCGGDIRRVLKHERAS